MITKNYKKRASELVKIAKEKGLITKYSDFCNTKKSKEYSLSEDEVIYYTSFLDTYFNYLQNN